MPLRVIVRPDRRSPAVRPAAPADNASLATPHGPLPFGLPLPPKQHKQLPAGVTLCMIVKNEEAFLEQCLRSVVDVVDEMVIIDTGSTDATVEIARRFGARVEHRAWRNDFAWARNEAIELATKRWIIMLDADEELVPESKPLLKSVGQIPAHLAGLWLRCFNLVDDYKGTGASSHALTRIFPNNPRLRFSGAIHEYITTDGSTKGIDARFTPISILHHGYMTSVIASKNKAARNLELVKSEAERDPENPFVWYNLGMTAMIVKDADLAIESLEKMRVLVGAEARAFVPVALTQLADGYIDFRKDYARATELCLEALVKSPRYANAHFILGRSYSFAGRYEEAREAYLAAIADGAYNDRQFVVDNEVSAWKAATEIGVTYNREGRRQEALEWFDKALVARPGVQVIHSFRARTLDELGRFDEAAQAFRTIWETFGDDESAVTYVNYQLRLQQWEAALESIELAAPRVAPRVRRQLFVAASQVVRHTSLPPDAAQEYLERALEACPGSGVVLDALEKWYAGRGDRAAVAALNAREMNAPLVEPEDFGRRALRHLALGDVPKARALAEEALANAPGHPSLLYALASVEAHLRELPSALARLESIDARDPEMLARGTYLRSVVLFDLGRYADALAAIETFLASASQSAQGHLHRARVLEKIGRPDEAIAVLEALMAPGNHEVGIELAGLYMRTGAYEKARETADAALVASSPK